MTHTVAAIASAATTREPQRTSAARSAGTSFAQVQAAAVKSTDAKETSAFSSTDEKKKATSSAPKGERTQKVDGHNYVEVVAGPRNGMFINNTGGRRDGEAFLIVKRHGREFHIYGSGDDRKVYEVGRRRESSSGSSDAKTSATNPSAPTTSGTTDTSAGASTTGTTGSGTTTA